MVACARPQARAGGFVEDRDQAESRSFRGHILGPGRRAQESGEGRPRRRVIVAGARGERAPAKINLTRRVIARRPDCYHDIESLVAFAGVADRLSFTPDRMLALAVGGPMAARCGELADNLVLKAAHALSQRVAGLKVGRFLLSKRLPVAAGLGGGSSDAAAALRLLARGHHLSLQKPRPVRGGAGA